MAVYRRRYQAVLGELTPRSLRFLVFTRYALRNLLASRLFILYIAMCFGAPIVGAIMIYLHFNPLGLQAIKTTIDQLVPINGSFFLIFLIIQTSMGSVLAAVIGPSLVAPDLANNALPLYLSRPVRRNDYILGKLLVLIGIMSVLTWIPLMLMYGLQCGLAGWTWFSANIRIGIGIMCCSALWIFIVSLLTLAISAWVRWRPIATLAVFGYFLISSSFAGIVNIMLHTDMGNIFNIAMLMRFLWTEFFGVPPMANALPTPVVIVILALTSLVFYGMLLRRIRAYEVVR